MICLIVNYKFTLFYYYACKLYILNSYYGSYSNVLVQCSEEYFNPLSANLKKWSNTLKQFVGNLPTYCLSVFDHFVGLAIKGLIK